MEELKCPHCGKVFEVDQTGYENLVRQIRNKEFEKEMDRRQAQMAQQTQSTLAIERLEQQKKQEQLVAKGKEAVLEKEKEIAALQLQLQAEKAKTQMAVLEAVGQKDKELNLLSGQVTKLQGQLEVKATESQLSLQTLKESYETKLKDKEEQIEYYKDFKARQSTKMIGESLEQHCLNEFNSLRATAFPQAYFEKDNDAKTGSKGDFIFRDYVDGIPYISIMFEMKNEADQTKTKHKNEDFFKELDKDRTEKQCEYAVLVSLLEGDSEFYNTGIVDVSYRYPKMYVIRPQFFIPLISLLRNAALNTLAYQKELALVKSQQVDLTNFEENLAAFKAGFTKNFKDAGDRFADAIAGIDKAIDQLEKIKKALTTSEKHLAAANHKIEDVTIKKLTKNAPSVRAMFQEQSEG